MQEAQEGNPYRICEIAFRDIQFHHLCMADISEADHRQGVHPPLGHRGCRLGGENVDGRRWTAAVFLLAQGGRRVEGQGLQKKSGLTIPLTHQGSEDTLAGNDRHLMTARSF